MATTKEIKTRIKSVKDTQKITNAMYLIASKKMRKAKAELDRTRPYFNAVQSEIKRAFRTCDDVDSRYFYPTNVEKPLEGPSGFLVITADKGLAGAYNQNVIKEALKQMEIHGGDGSKLFVVGEYGRQYFLSHNIPVEKSFLYTAQNPNLDRAREITALLLDQYNQGELEKIYVIYTDLESVMKEEAKFERMLPFHRASFYTDAKDEIHTSFDFLPSVNRLLDAIVPSYLTGYIYSALVDSFCSEQNARMTAMDTASNNATELIDDLSTLYNHVRQGAITQEITEISSGAQAMKNKQKVKS